MGDIPEIPINTTVSIDNKGKGKVVKLTKVGSETMYTVEIDKINFSIYVPAHRLKIRENDLEQQAMFAQQSAPVP